MKENGLTLEKARSRRYPTRTIMDADYADDIALLANTSAQAESLLHTLERTAGGIDLDVNANKTEYMCFDQCGDIFTLNGGSLKRVNKFTYLGSSVSSTENHISTWLANARIAIDRQSVIWNSDMSDKIKHNFYQAAVVSILLYGCTTWKLTKRMEKNLDGNCTSILRAILNKSGKQHPIKQRLYSYQPTISN